MDLTEGSETSAIINRMPGNYPKERLLHSVHGESLKSRHTACKSAAEGHISFVTCIGSIFYSELRLSNTRMRAMECEVLTPNFYVIAGY